MELDSLVAMGFPPPRVARALLRSGDKSKASVVVVVVVEHKFYLMRTLSRFVLVLYVRIV